MEETNFHRESITGLEMNPEWRGSLSASIGKEEDTKSSPSPVVLPDTHEGNHMETGTTVVPGRKSYTSRLKLIEVDGFRRKNHLLRLMMRPILFLLFPVISYAGFSYGCSVVWLAFMNATESAVFANAPYDFPTSIVGLTFISPLVGNTLA